MWSVVQSCTEGLSESTNALVIVESGTGNKRFLHDTRFVELNKKRTVIQQTLNELSYWKKNVNIAARKLAIVSLPSFCVACKGYNTALNH